MSDRTNTLIAAIIAELFRQSKAQAMEQMATACAQAEQRVAGLLITNREVQRVADLYSHELRHAKQRVAEWQATHAWVTVLASERAEALTQAEERVSVLEAALTTMIVVAKRVDRSDQVGEGLRECVSQSIIDCEAALTPSPPAPRESPTVGTLLNTPITEAERQCISKDGP